MKPAEVEETRESPRRLDHGRDGCTLLVVAHCARIVLKFQSLPARDECALWQACLWLDAVGTWWACCDALRVLALSKGRDAGRKLRPPDFDLLREILDRMHATLKRLDRAAET